MMGKTRSFVLREGGRDTEHVFTGRQPRQAALKAATRGHTEINLRERGTKKVHRYRGSVEVVDAPENSPGWLPSKVKKPRVKKLGIQKLEKL